MAKTIVIMTHSRGNHSIEQVYYHGKEVFRGNAKEAREYWAQMVKFCKDKWHNTCTNDSQRDFVAYEMSDMWAIDITDGKPKRFYI